MFLVEKILSFSAERLSKNQSSSTSKLSNEQKKKDVTPEASKEDGKKNVQVKNAKAVVITIS
jgi:hypothetical protein